MGIELSRREIVRASGILATLSLAGCQTKDSTKELIVENEYSDTLSIKVSVSKISPGSGARDESRPPEGEEDTEWRFEWFIDELNPGDTRKKTALFSEKGTYWVSAEFSGKSGDTWVTGGTRSGTEVFVTVQKNGQLSVDSPTE